MPLVVTCGVIWAVVVVVVAVLDFSVPWHFRQSGGPQRPALGPLEYEQHR